METYAFGTRIGVVLLQNDHPTAYISKMSRPHHQLLSAYEKDMFAVLFAVKKWEKYLMGKHFKIRTDHQPLKYMLDQKLIVPNQYAWLPKLMAYDFEIQYKQGKANIVANALSRVHSHGIMMHAISTVSTKLLERIKPTWQCASLECTGLKQGNSVPPYSWSQDCLIREN